MERIDHTAVQKQGWTPSPRLFPQSTLLPQLRPFINSDLAQITEAGCTLAGHSPGEGSVVSPRAPAGREGWGSVGLFAPAFLLHCARLGPGSPGSARQLHTGWQTVQLSGLFPSMISLDAHANPSMQNLSPLLTMED